jgi:anhydro-N-acetylmuramic acid kinase
VLVVGLMSGTSADGVTAALVNVGRRSIEVLRCRTFSYTPALKKRVMAAASMTAEELSRLNFELGAAFASAARRISIGHRPRLAGSHGQTVWHGPQARPANTLQLAEPSVIAEHAGLAVVADFRPRDMAAGGEGAPLMPAFDEFLFSRGPLRALQNIGGIGNVSVAGAGRVWTAFDTGPGNSLMDAAVRLATNGRLEMDRGGRLAARGWADVRKAAALLRQPFFSQKPPKSIDRSLFNEAYLLKNFGRPRPRTLPDLLATLTLLTARSIEDSYQRFILPRWRVKEVIVSGGGALNPTLMRALKDRLSPLKVTTSQSHGIPPMAKEAACFAWLAARAFKGKTNNCPRATGAAGRRILGKIIPA